MVRVGGLYPRGSGFDSQCHYMEKGVCRFCLQKFANRAVGIHVTRCKLNPDRKVNTGKIGRKLSIQHREILSDKRSTFLDNNVGSGFPNVKWYRVQNQDNVEFIVRGLWEVEVAKFLNEKKIAWTRGKRLQYVNIEGVKKNYTPDFYLLQENSFLEVKGYFSLKDQEKMRMVREQNDVKIVMIFNPAELSGLTWDR